MDPVPHLVLGANGRWGSFEQFGEGGAVTYRFPAPGVYPYVCSLHPGMTGAVVVGRATRPPGLTVAARIVPVPAAPADRPVSLTYASAPVAASGTPGPGSGDAWRIAALAASGLTGLLGAAAAALARRARGLERGAPGPS